MTDFFQKDIKICISFEAENQALDTNFGKEVFTSSSYYDARIVYNHRIPNYIDLIIFYTLSDRLIEKLTFLNASGVNILKNICSKPADKDWIFPDILDFQNSNLISIKESHDWEYDKKPIVLTIDNLDLLTQNRQNGDGIFQLTENALQHIDEYIHYGQLANQDYNDPFISINKNKKITFGNIELKLSFEHDYGKSSKYKFEIYRDAFLTINDQYNSLSEKEIIEHGNLICILLSFYWEKPIDFFIAHIRLNNYPNYFTRQKYNYSNHYIDETSEHFLKSRYETVYDFIESLNYSKTLNCSLLLKEIVFRINKAKNIDEISEFMLLYNVIEKIRNFCLENPLNEVKLEIREEFKFTISKSSTKKYIEEKIKQIVEIVDESNSKEFLNLANEKVSSIKKTSLINQFYSLMSYFELNKNTYDLDFENLIKIRNNIYHGKDPKQDIKPFNSKMRLLIIDLTLMLIQKQSNT